MTPTFLSLGALLLLAPLAATPQDTSQGGGLQRVSPGAQATGPRKLRSLFDEEFDAAQWRERLRVGDLEQREQNYDALLKRARLDPAARAFLEEAARDPQGGELAWTARLALRELGRARFPLQGMLPGPDPLGMADQMQQMMQELFAQDMGLLVPPSAPQMSPGRQGGRSSAHGVHVEQGPQGARVQVTETIDGQERTTTYEGASLEEILRDNPDLAAELGGLHVQTDPRAPLDLRFDLGRLGDPFLDLFQRQGGLRLAPQDRSRPVITDRLGVVVGPLGAERAKELGLEKQGLLVQQTSAGTYAHLLGVSTGDVLIELDGRALRDGADIEQAMRARKADDPLTLTWIDKLGQRQQKTWRPQK